MVRRQSSSLSPSLSPTCHLAISPKAVPEGNRMFRGQSQRPSAWGRSPALLGRVGRASTYTGRFRVGGSRDCSLEENRLPLLRYGLNSRVKKVLMLCEFRAAKSTFFSYKIKFWMGLSESKVCVIGETSMSTEAAPIASLNLSISHGSLSKNMTKEQNGMFQIEPCAKQQI